MTEDLPNKLIKAKIMTTRQNQQWAKRGQASDEKRVGYLLDHLAKKPCEDFQKFLDILEEDGQGDMVKRCENADTHQKGAFVVDGNTAEDEEQTTDDWKGLLIKHRVELVEGIDPEQKDPEKGNFYENCKLISKDARQTWQKGETADVEHQVEELLDFISRRSNGEFVSFCKALKSSGQGAIVREFFPETAKILGLSPNRGLDQGKKRPCQEPSEAVSCTTPKVTSEDKEEDEGIILSDGPLEVQVIPCDLDFYSKLNKKGIYKMSKGSKGQAMIINVNKVDRTPARAGTDIDRDNLYNMCTQLGFVVTVYNDEDELTAEDIADKVQHFSCDPKHKKGQAVMVFILSHGTKGAVYGTDGQKVSLEAIIKSMDHKSLNGKPKLLFVNACRGGHAAEGMECDDEVQDDSLEANRKDFFQAFPTQEGYKAWREPSNGSWFISALVQVFVQCAATTDICAMMHRVNNIIAKKVTPDTLLKFDNRNKTQMSEYKSTFTKDYFYFLPGIDED